MNKIGFHERTIKRKRATRTEILALYGVNVVGTWAQKADMYMFSKIYPQNTKMPNLSVCLCVCECKTAFGIHTPGTTYFPECPLQSPFTILHSPFLVIDVVLVFSIRVVRLLCVCVCCVF